MKNLKISILTPVYNEAHQIEGYLKNVREQDYPQDKIEIIIADGGSTDDTVKIAKQYGCRIIDNPDKFAEPGLVRCEEAATGDLMAIMAADNRMPSKDWLKVMSRPFIEDENVWGAYTHIEAADNDNNFNRYYSLLHVEPFTWFVYGNAANPRYFKHEYKIMEKKPGYVIYEFKPKNHPLIAFAQGFVIRRGFKRKPENKGDDVLPFIQMIEDGHKIAYVPEAGVYHFHLRSFSHYFKKYQWRIRNSLYKNNVGFDNRAKYLTFGRKLRKYLWIIYGCSVIGPVFHGVWWALRDRQICWLWHIPASVGLSALICYEVTRQKILKLFGREKLVCLN